MEAVPNVTKTNVPGKQTIREKILFRIFLTKKFRKKFSDKNVPYFATTALLFFPHCDFYSVHIVPANYLSETVDYLNAK